MNITLLVLIIFVPILALILLGLNTLLAPHKAYEEKNFLLMKLVCRNTWTNKRILSNPLLISCYAIFSI